MRRFTLSMAALFAFVSCSTAVDEEPTRTVLPGVTVTDAGTSGGQSASFSCTLPADAVVSVRAWSSGPLVGIVGALFGPSGTKLWSGDSRGTSISMEGVRTAEAGAHTFSVRWTEGQGVASYRFEILSTTSQPFQTETLLNLALADVDSPRGGAVVVPIPSTDGLSDRVLVAGGYSGGSASAAGPLGINGEAVLVDPFDGSTQIVGGLETGRAFASSVLVGAGSEEFAGRVIVVGGIGPTGAALASIEVYNPADSTFTSGPNLPEERAYMTTLTIEGTDSFLDGKIVLAGGERTRSIPQNDNDTGLYAEIDENPREVWYFDPTTGSIQKFTQLDGGRVGVAVVILSDGRLLFIGGGLDTVPSSPGCVDGPDVRCVCNPGGVLPLCTLYSDCVDGICKATSFTRKDVATRQIETYDTATGTHRVLPESAWLNRGRVGHAVALLSGDRVLVAGGATAVRRSFQRSELGLPEAPRVVDSVELYEPENEAFRVLSPLNVPRESAAFLDGGSAGWFLVGGLVPEPGGVRPTASLERFLSTTERFEAAGGVAIARWGAAVVRLPRSGGYLLIGGEDAYGAIAAIERIEARAVTPSGPGSDADVLDGDAVGTDDADAEDEVSESGDASGFEDTEL